MHAYCVLSLDWGFYIVHCFKQIARNILATKGNIAWICLYSVVQLTGQREMTMKISVQKQSAGAHGVSPIGFQAQHIPPTAISNQRGFGCLQWHFYCVTGSNYPFPCLLFLIYFRTWRSESAWGGFCEWTTTPGCSPPKDSGTCSPRCQALRHLQAASSQPWLCQQNSWQVKAGASGFPFQITTSNHDFVVVIVRILVPLGPHMHSSLGFWNPSSATGIKISLENPYFKWNIE